MADDRSVVEVRAAELAHLTAMFFRKLLDEQVPPFVAQSLASTYLNTLMFQDNGKPGREPWEKSE
jgi:hypothetical protein